MDPLTPNTSAFLSYLSSNLDDNSINTSYDSTANPTPASFPPSAFFPMPGRDTPEDTPPSSVEASQSPEKITDINRLRNDGALASGSDYDGNESTGKSAKGKKGNANHKRKAVRGQHKDDAEDEDDEDSGSDSADVHEDKRQHQNKAGTKKGGRKSIGDDGKGGSKSDKAARRKEQNRAAQKAFRERREAKVKDLEDQLAELERKAYGTTVENENLRGILKRLQEENVALRQSAFTFSMPVNGSPTNGTGTNTPTQAAQKPPTPPHQNSADDVLRSIHDAPTVPRPQPQLPQRKSSSLNQESPDSLVSVHSGQSSASGVNPATINLFNDPNNAFSAAALGGLGPRPDMPGHFDSSSSNTTGTTSSAPSDIPSLSPGDRTELDALWASFLNPTNKSQPSANVDGSSHFSLINAQPQPAAFAGSDAKIGAQTTNDWDKFAFRDAAVAPAAEQAPAPQAQPAQQAQWLPQSDPWAGMLDNGIDDFLASLSGSNNNAVPQEKDQTDEDFNAQIQQILGGNLSPSDPFNLPANPFSPTNYLNMSPAGTSNPSNGPSPLSSLSNSASPESGSYGAPPASSDVMSGYSTIGPHKSEAEHIYVVDESGKVIKPSELWVRMGMQHESNLEHLLIDDLCDMMRSKATCKDGKAYLAASDAEQMFKYPNSDPAHAKRLQGIEQRAGIADGAFSCPRK